MGLKSKEIVEGFYTALFNGGEEVLNSYLHPNVEFVWYGTTGVKKLGFDEILAIREDMAKNYESLKAEIEKTVEENNQLAIQFTYYVKTIENPDEELPLAHFMAIWELKENKLFRGVQISQLGEEVEDSPWD